MHALEVCISQYTKFEVPSFTKYKDDWDRTLNNGSHD